MIDSVARIEAVIRRHRWTDISDTGRTTTINFVVKDFVLVEMSVSEKLAGNRRFVPVFFFFLFFLKEILVVSYVNVGFWGVIYLLTMR